MGQVGAAALALALGVAGLMGPAGAQQPAPAPAPPAAKKPPAAAPAQKAPAAAAAAAPATPQSVWVKLCEKVPAVKKDKDGKEEKAEVNICRTQHERIDINSGRPLVSAAIQQVEGQEKQGFVVMVPLGAFLPEGMQATVYPKDLWAKVEKNETLDEAKLKEAKLRSVKLIYTLCQEIGCIAEAEATTELVNELKTAGGLLIVTLHPSGRPIGLPVPLNGFTESYGGKPADMSMYKDQRRALMQQIAQRQYELAEEHKKQEEAKKGGAAPQPAPPANAPPAPAPKR